MATKIEKKPTSKVKSHTAPARNGYGVGSSWKVPANETKDTNHKASNTDVSWTIFYRQGKTRNIKLTRSAKTGDASTTSSSMSIDNFTTTAATRKADKGKTFKRTDFYPHTTRMITRIDHIVALANAKGTGPKSTATTTFLTPDPPTVGAYSFDTETGTVKVKITAAKSIPRRDRVRTQYTFTVQKGKYVETTQKFTVKETKKSESDKFDGGAKSLSYDCRDYQSLTDGELYLITLTAYSQGFTGDSASVSRRFIVAPPATTTISDPTITTEEGGRVVVPVRMNRKGVYVKKGNKSEFDYYVNPIDGVILQAAVNVAAKSASSVPGDAWNDVGAVDDGDCEYLTANTADLTPEMNNYSYIRVKSWRFDSECAPMCRYSNVKPLSKLRTTETATDDECGILELTSTSDGTGAYLLVGYDKIGQGAEDDADGTEVSWADSSTAWRSNEQPETFEVTWGDATSSASEGSAGYPYRNIWRYVQPVYIKGLDEGTQYWFRARRYNDDANGNRTYGTYCTKIWGTETAKTDVKTNATVTPTVKPTNVTLLAPSSVPIGSDITLTWTYDGGDQTGYRIYLGSGDRIVASSNSASSSCVLKQSTYSEYVESNGTLRIMVSVSTSKRRDTFTEAAWASVTFADPPVLEVDAPTVTAQPATINLYSTTASSTASVTVVAQGSGGDDAIGIEPQLVGDDVWSTVAQPTWDETTWGDTAWYANNVTAAVDAADDAWDALDLTTDTYTGGTDASLVDVEVGDDGEERPYIVVQPSDDIGPYMLATATVDGTTYELATDAAWCDATGEDDDEGTYIRLPWPMSLYDDQTTDEDNEQTDAFVGCTVTLTYLAQGEGADDAWDAYSELRATADALTAIHDPDEVVYEASVEIPPGTDLRDDAGYALSATVVSAGSGLVSNTAESTFAVAWAHQAPTPSDGITVTPYDTTDEDGNRAIGASIKLAAPTGVAATDMADVWRVAADGWHRIAEGRGLTDTVIDEYAPFGDADLAYRVVMRTADGDTDWADYGYTLNLNHTRLDFGGSYIELPYNIAISHNYSKDSEQRQHLGESLPRGYWGDAHGRSFSISSDLVRQASREQRALLHELGCYMGPVLVRTPDGCCMEAEVTPDHSFDRNSAVPTSIRGTEIELTAEHMARAEDEEEEQQGGE